MCDLVINPLYISTAVKRVERKVCKYLVEDERTFADWLSYFPDESKLKVVKANYDKVWKGVCRKCCKKRCKCK